MPESFSNEDILDGKIYAILAYLSILCIIPLILKKSNPFVLAHGKQGLVLFVIQTAVWIISIVIPGILTPMTFVIMILSFLGLLAVLQGKFLQLPVVSSFAEKISL